MGLVLAVSVAVPGLLKATSTSAGGALPTTEYFVALDCGSGPGVDCNIPAPASGALDVAVKFGNPVAMGGARNVAAFNFDVFNPNPTQLGVGVGVPARNPVLAATWTCVSPAADDDTGSYGAGTTDWFISCDDAAGVGDSMATGVTTLATVHYNMAAAVPGVAALQLFSVQVADENTVPLVTCDLSNAPPEPPVVPGTQCINVTINFTGQATATNTPVPPTATMTNTPVPPTATNTPVPPTATMTNTPGPPTATNTAVPPTATNTAVPPTATNTAVPPTATNTVVGAPTSTNTPVPPTATNTAVPPTATNTTVPPTATNTAVPPTATNTAVPPTATNTSVPVPTSTNTAVPPTATNTAVGVPTSTNTPVVSQTAQPSQTAQITHTPQVTHTAQASQTPPTETSTSTPVNTATSTATPVPTETPHTNKTHTPQATTTRPASTSTAPAATATKVAAVAGAAKPPARGGAAGTITLPNAGQGGGNSTLSYMLAILVLAGTGTGMVGAVVYRQYRR